MLTARGCPALPQTQSPAPVPAAGEGAEGTEQHPPSDFSPENNQHH